MRAAEYRRYGAPEVVHVTRLPKPAPAADELLVRVHASTVSVADHRIRSRDVPRGLWPLVASSIGVFRPRHRVLGMEAAGTVEAVGAEVTTFAPGDDVVLLRGSRFGGHAEYVTVREGGTVAKKPEGLSFEEAVAVVFGGTTAVSFFGRAEIGEGTRVLVNGASGAVGTMAVQLAAQRGAVVTGVTSGRNAGLVRSLGATRVIDYETEDFAAGDETWDVIVECVGNAPYTRVADSLAPGGALLLVVTDLVGMLRLKRDARRSGGVVTMSGPVVTGEQLGELLALTASGAIRPVVDRTYELDDIVEAHRYVDTGRKRGAVVVRVP
ncbi:NADPH:quinone reductase [Agromyces rhizosphaerae]|uniref:NADPH:quinone reductase n=2 Tax=Agromyces rhizosphaerae TaxID=88374 RepID=A0A9W6CYS7_9MICO|nr:NADPH:quinone reductase [Agromyces rhizosphaerae]